MKHKLIQAIKETLNETAGLGLITFGVLVTVTMLGWWTLLIVTVIFLINFSDQQSQEEENQ